MSRPTLTIIQSTHASLDGFKLNGLLERHRRLLKEYSKTFRVVLYTSDTTDYSAELDVEHHPVPWLPRSFGWRHLMFYLWLIWRSLQMKGVIKVFGSNIPTLPLMKLLSRCPMMVTYQWDYAEVTRKNERTRLKYWLAPILEMLALRPADLVLVTATWLQDKIHRVYRKKTVLLPNWVDLSVLDQGGEEKTRDKKLIVFAGRLHWAKGVNVLLEAFAYVKQQYSDALLMVCGEGEERNSLENQVKSLHVEGVEFTGRFPNSEVLRLMSRAAIFVLPTLTMEGHPKALIEAMACGAACVATNVQGNKEIIIDGETGLLVPAYDVETLSNVLERLLNDKSLRARLGQAAQVEARRYSFSSIVPREVETLASLASNS